MHQITKRKTKTGLAADCICGHGVESEGRDESSRGAIRAWVKQHNEENK